MSQQQPQLDVQKILQDFHGRLASIDSQMLMARKAIAALQGESVLNRLKHEPTMPIEFTSQFGEDLLAWHLFGHQPSGFFIEAGAFDGYRYSVTYPFEAIGWRGLLVEAIPERAKQCAERRKGSKVVNAALASRGSTGNTTFWVVEDQYGGMLSYSKPTPDHLAGVGNRKKTSVSVPLASLDNLLADHQGEIDLFVLDVEGAEFDALAGFDINKHRPRLMLIEDNSGGRNPALRNAMQPYPYAAVGYLAVNAIFIRNDQTELLERLKWMMMG